MSDPITIRKLIDRISSGDIRIPAFQRNFVWEPDQVAFLLDSIYKGFPIGTVILWKTDSRLTTEKKLGFFTLPEPQKDYPVNYVLDGQQRLTSLFSVFQTELTPNSGEWTDIYFDMDAIENVQESVFLALDDPEVDAKRHFPMKTIFDSVAYRQATANLSDLQVRRIDELQSKFKEYLIPNEVFETEDRNRVAIVFERINRAGTELNVFELLSAWSWSDDFDLVEKFAELQEKIADHGFEELCDDKDLQLRICAGVITGETTPKMILDLKGDDIRSRFSDIERGILGALDFIKREANVRHYKMLPFPGLLVPMSCFFATDKVEGIVYTDMQRDKLLRWFWRSLFTRRFSADVNQRQAQDIVEMLNLRKDDSYAFKYPKVEIKFDFSKSLFSSSNANSRVHILLLNSMTPHSFMSGAKIDLDEVLKKSSKHEFHHIYPKKYLERKGYEQSKINVLSNICFLTRGDNNKIKDKSPCEYLKKVDPNKMAFYMKNSLCPEDFSAMSYEDFISARTDLLIKRAEELMA